MAMPDDEFEVFLKNIEDRGMLHAYKGEFSPEQLKTLNENKSLLVICARSNGDDPKLTLSCVASIEDKDLAIECVTALLHDLGATNIHGGLVN